MGLLTPAYSASLIQNLTGALESNSVLFYGVASNPVPHSGLTTNVSSAAVDWWGNTVWRAEFGKRIASDDIANVIYNIPWVSGKVYAQYDDQDAYLQSESFYVVYGNAYGVYNVYKCIYNNGGVASTQPPTLIQMPTFYNTDGYGWRYMFTIDSSSYASFASADYVPIVANTTVEAQASSYSGVDVVTVVTGGSGYAAYCNGVVKGLATVNAPGPIGPFGPIKISVVQIAANSSGSAGFYAGDNVYLYDPSTSYSQMLYVTGYTVNGAGNWLSVNGIVNTSFIVPGRSTYNVHPAVTFDTDGVTQPMAYSTINPQTNSIASIVVVEPGVGITRASANVSSNSNFGSGATVRCIAPPPGGHGSNPSVELGVVGMAVTFEFSNSELGTIPINVSYDRVSIATGLVSATSNSALTSNTFLQLLEGSVSPPTAFAVGDELIGTSSLAKGLVAFSNSSTLYMTGDKTFALNEILSNGTITVTLSAINRSGDVVPSSMELVYVQNINNVARANGQVESFVLTIAPTATT